jgi:hypothetical protein
MTEKRFRVTISNTNVVSFVDVVENKQLMSITFKNKSDAIDCKNALMYQCDLLNTLHEEKEYWKFNCCSQDSFNSILFNELDIAQQQGYEVSDSFKKLMEKKS